MEFLIPAGILLIVLIGIIGMYNSLVKIRQQCKESWSDIDTELKRRYDLIPNLVETVKGYAKHERETLDAVIQARTRAVASTGSPESQAADENTLVGSMKTLFAVAESYPDLKADKNFLRLQSELANTEDRIQASRRFYNGNVRDMKVRIESFPSSLIAGMFGFQSQEFFKIEDASVRIAPDVSM